MKKPANVDIVIADLENALAGHWTGNYYRTFSPPANTGTYGVYDPNADIVMACIYGAIDPTAGLARERRHLLEEQRVPLARADDARACRRIEFVAELHPERLAFRGPERLEHHRGGVELGAAPGRPVLEELRPGRAQKQDRRVSGKLDDVVEKIQQHRLGPLQVVDVQDHRPLRGQ
ncbi:MAG: hypothetical protein ACXVHB_25340 [Solirubrobacteraceae bacterium]